jgi:FlaG/FlaF family flagellin (archaellin)
VPVTTQVPREEISGGMKILLYVVSFLIPLAGFIIGIIFYTRPDQQSKHVGKVCIIIGIIAMVLNVGLAALLYVMVLGFGSNGGFQMTPAATYTDQTVFDGRKITILAITNADVSWDEVTIQLTDGFSFATWQPDEYDLSTGPAATASYGYRTCGSLSVSCSVTDLAGDGCVSGSDYFVLSATFASGSTYEAWLLYEPNSEKIGTGASWSG